jgi:hypothetical protein
MQVRSTVCSMHFKQIDYRQVKIAHPAQTQEKKAKQSPPHVCDIPAFCNWTIPTWRKKYAQKRGPNWSTLMFWG